KVVHREFAETLERAYADITSIQAKAREGGSVERPRWPMIVLRTPKGWTGPKEVDGKKTEDFWRSHQVPLAELASNPDHLVELEQWLRSYGPDELFDDEGQLVSELRELTPLGLRRMGSNPHANGGLLLRDLRLPDFREYAVDVPAPGATNSEATRVLGDWLRDVIRDNPSNFRLFGPDETESNRLGDVYEVTSKQFEGQIVPGDNHVAQRGQVMEVLSEPMCQGWLAGYLLAGRDGRVSC